MFAYAPNPTGFIDPLGLVTLHEAEDSLIDNPEIEPLHPATPPQPRMPGRKAQYAREDVFEEWLRLERLDTAWLNELQGLECPILLDDARDNANFRSPSTFMVSWYHPGAETEVRSRTTPGGHSNQCMYDNRGQILREPPGAGSADRVACETKGFCPTHKANDVDTYTLAKKLGRVGDYYSVRPTIIISR